MINKLLNYYFLKEIYSILKIFTPSIMVSNNTILNTKEEYIEEINSLQLTYFGNIINIIKPEIKRVILFGTMKLLIGVHFNFCKIFKDTILYNILDNVNAVYWLQVIIFFVSFKAIKLFNSLFVKYGPNKAIDIFLFISAGFYLIFTIFIFINSYFFNTGTIKAIINSNVLLIRGLGFIENILIILVNFIMVIYYLMVDILSNLFINIVFFMYMNYNTTPNQFPRYFKIVGLFNGISHLITSYIVNNMIIIQSKYFCVSNEKYLYIMIYFCNTVLIMVIYGLKYLLDNEITTNILYKNENEDKGILKTKSKTSINFKNIVILLTKSNILYSLVLFSTMCNFVSSGFSLIDKYVYKAYALYCSMEPSANPLGNNIPNVTNISMYFKSFEMINLFFGTIFLMISPFMNAAWKLFGFLGYGILMILLYAFVTLTSSYWAIYNYPFTNFGKPVIFNLHFKNLTPNFWMEAIFISVNNFIVKMTKYTFMDAAIEVALSRINPFQRGIYKTIASGIVPNTVKLLLSFYGIISNEWFRIKDMRYLLVLSTIIAFIIILFTIKPIFFLSKEIKKAEKTDTYINDSNIYLK